MSVSEVRTGVLDAIGRTPLVRLGGLPAESADVYLKLESVNPTGSYKDRMARAMIEEAERRGDLRPGMTVVEYTGGSTGSSLAFVCAAKGYRFRVVSSDAFAAEKLRTMRAFGAELTLVQSRGGQITPDLVPRLMAAARQVAAEAESYFTDQLHNRDSLVGYRGVGEEVLAQLGVPDLFCAAVGTAGLLMGVASVLRERDARVKVVAFEPASSPVLSRGQAGTHHVEGIGIGFRPPLFDDALVDEVRPVDEGEARATARALARTQGIFGGTSSGLNVAGALRLARELGPGRRVVTVVCDTGLKYLQGRLYDP